MCVCHIFFPLFANHSFHMSFDLLFGHAERWKRQKPLSALISLTISAHSFSHSVSSCPNWCCANNARAWSGIIRHICWQSDCVWFGFIFFSRQFAFRSQIIPLGARSRNIIKYLFHSLWFFVLYFSDAREREKESEKTNWNCALLIQLDLNAKCQSKQLG